MEISIITICNKKDNNAESLVVRYISQIEKFYKVSIINITFQTKKIKKNLYEKEYRKALSLIKPGSILIEQLYRSISIMNNHPYHRS